jgi:LPXTG-motif cell wall-anchored protein
MKAKATEMTTGKAMWALLAVAIVGALVLAPTPAVAEEGEIELGVFQAIYPLLQQGVVMTTTVQPEIGDAGGWEMVPVEPILDAGDWAPFFPEDEGDEQDTPVPDDGADEPYDEGDENDIQDNGDDEGGDEGDVPDDGQDEGDEPEDDGDEPEDEDEDRPYLPFTGGNEVGFLIMGGGMVLAGAGFLTRKRWTLRS